MIKKRHHEIRFQFILKPGRLSLWAGWVVIGTSIEKGLLVNETELREDVENLQEN